MYNVSNTPTTVQLQVSKVMATTILVEIKRLFKLSGQPGYWNRNFLLSGIADDLTPRFGGAHVWFSMKCFASHSLFVVLYLIRNN